MSEENEKKNISLVPVGKVVNLTPVAYQHSPYRNLTAIEISLLVIVLHENRGSYSATVKDDRSPVKGNASIYYYKRKYGLESRLEQYRAEMISEYKKQSVSILNEGKIKAVKRALELLEDRELEFIHKKTGDKIKFTKSPEYKEIQCAWEIIKTELNEPVKIKEIPDEPDNESLKQIKVIFENYSDDNKAESNLPTPISI